MANSKYNELTIDALSIQKKASRYFDSLSYPMVVSNLARYFLELGRLGREESARIDRPVIES